MKTIRANTILLALTTLSVVSISCTHIKHIASSNRGVASYKALGLSNKQLEGSSIENAPEVIKNWLGDSVSDLANENVPWSLQRSGEDDIVVNVEVTDLEATKGNQDNIDGSGYVYEPLHMYIDASIREHRLGNYFVNIIHKAARIWETNIGKDLFTISNYHGQRRRNTFSKYNGTSNIYYEYSEKEEDEARFGFINRRLRTDIKSLIFNFKINRIVVETDIIMNGNMLEEDPHCIRLIKPTHVNHLPYSSKGDRCTLVLFMAIMMHELGHVLLLGHSDNAQSAMKSPSYVEDMLERTPSFFDEELLHQDDIDAFNEED